MHDHRTYVRYERELYRRWLRAAVTRHVCINILWFKPGLTVSPERGEATRNGKLASSPGARLTRLGGKPHQMWWVMHTWYMYGPPLVSCPSGQLLREVTRQDRHSCDSSPSASGCSRLSEATEEGLYDQSTLVIHVVVASHEAAAMEA